MWMLGCERLKGAASPISHANPPRICSVISELPHTQYLIVGSVKVLHHCLNERHDERSSRLSWKTGVSVADR